MASFKDVINAVRHQFLGLTPQIVTDQDVRGTLKTINCFFTLKNDGIVTDSDGAGDCANTLIQKIRNMEQVNNNQPILFFNSLIPIQNAEELLTILFLGLLNSDIAVRQQLGNYFSNLLDVLNEN